MATILTAPIQVPPTILKVQRIDGVYIDYKSHTVSITVGSYTELNSEEPEKTETEGFDLDELASSEYLTHFKFVFRSIREAAIAANLIGAGEHTDD